MHLYVRNINPPNAKLKKPHIQTGTQRKSCSLILSPCRGDIVDSGIGLSYRPARLHKLASRYDNPMPESTKNLATGKWIFEYFSSFLSGKTGRTEVSSSIASAVFTIKFVFF